MAHIRSSTALSDLPAELIRLLLLSTDDVALLNLRSTSRYFNHHVLDYFQRLTNNRQHHPFSCIWMGIHPGCLAGVELLCQSQLYTLPWMLKCIYRDTVYKPIRAWYLFSDLQHICVPTHFREAWMDLTLKMLSFQEHEKKSHNSDSAEKLQSSQLQYARCFTNNDGKANLGKMLSKFKNLFAIALEQPFDWQTLPKEAKYKKNTFEFCERDIVNTCVDSFFLLAARPCHLDVFESQALAMRSKEWYKLLSPDNIPQVFSVSLRSSSGSRRSGRIWKTLLQHAVNVEDLDLSQNEKGPHCTSNDIYERFFECLFQGVYLPRLKTLKIENVKVMNETISSVLKTHCNTLRTLIYRPRRDFNYDSEMWLCTSYWPEVLHLDSAEVIIEKRYMKSVCESAEKLISKRHLEKLLACQRDCNNSPDYCDISDFFLGQ